MKPHENYTKIVNYFTALEPMLEEECGGPVYLVRIIGPRWSYVAGHVPSTDDVFYSAPQRVVLKEGSWALLFYPKPERFIDDDNIRSLFKPAIEGGEG